MNDKQEVIILQILCREHAEIKLTKEQSIQFITPGELGGRCPICLNIPRQVKKVKE